MQIHLGDWLEVQSKHGNSPGYVRSADARPIVVYKPDKSRIEAETCPF